MVLLALPPADHLLIERDRGQFVPSRRRRMMANVRAERLLKIPAEPSPELRIPALQLKREWSPWPEFGSDSGNPRELSKGYSATTFLSSSPTCRVWVTAHQTSRVSVGHVPRVGKRATPEG
jgi:hypothetical protein